MRSHDYDDEDYPLIPRNTPIKGQYFGMARMEAIIWGINAGVLGFYIFSKDADTAGIIRFGVIAAYLFFLRHIFSQQLFGRVIWRYALDMYHTFRAKKEYYFYEQRGDIVGFTDITGGDGDSGIRQEGQDN
ncbi:hypothetical protein [Paenibacillus lutrae]|uniref:Uncharacterized protein n=1 Tax=Paenibacillus lutrae TaxID=2078573 RepID=A0A7X3FM24_9BACL|nr:hypothetical protein [Paenibacillus lutrae]MVP02103.1 hypothetical protein [Paenibacillus lutrae]